jgi:hypothetical protein
MREVMYVPLGGNASAVSCVTMELSMGGSVRCPRWVSGWLLIAMFSSVASCTDGEPGVTRSPASTTPTQPGSPGNGPQARLAAHQEAEATAANCTGGQLRLRLRGVGAGAGTYYQTLLLRNTSARPCVADRVGVTYTTARLEPVGYGSASPQRLLDESIAKLVPRRALLAGERVFLRVGTVNPGGFNDGCGVTSAANEMIIINRARFVMSSGAQVCTIKNGRPFIAWGTPVPNPGRLPRDLSQPHLA